MAERFLILKLHGLLRRHCSVITPCGSLEVFEPVARVRLEVASLLEAFGPCVTVRRSPIGRVDNVVVLMVFHMRIPLGCY